MGRNDEVMLGAIIGDIVGSKYEFNNHRSKDFEFFQDSMFFTDDTVMTLTIAKAIIEWHTAMHDEDDNYSPTLNELTTAYMQAIGRLYPDCGYGGRFYQWVFSDNPQPYNSFGNGAAMRVSAIGWIAKSEDEVKTLSKAVTEVTHNHPEGIKGAEATAMAMFFAKQGKSIEEIKQKMIEYYPQLEDSDFTIDKIRPTYEFNEACQDTVPQALQAFFESESFEDAIRIAISVGGDSDTLAAITGSIAEVYYGVPLDIKQKSLSYLDESMLILFNEWNDFYQYNFT